MHLYVLIMRGCLEMFVDIVEYVFLLLTQLLFNAHTFLITVMYMKLKVCLGKNLVFKFNS